MNAIVLLIAILIPIVGGALIPLLPFKKRNTMLVYIETITVLTSVLVFVTLFRRPEEGFTLMRFTGDLTIGFRLDGLGTIFAGLVSFLWPLATLYSFEYMKHEKHEKIFFMFYIITFGVTLGISLAGNILTMYFFYEMLTLVTFPLVLHTLSREAVLASRKYLYYSLGGAAFAFIGMVFTFYYGTSTDFVLGGVFDLSAIGDKINILLFIYVMAFFGFGVKAAVSPFNSWLPDAGVAPTPVTALLHAVAVVKSGAFAIMRLTYYCFGTEMLSGSWAQYVVMAVVLFTILYGSCRALRETHFKRRLAYSTISNLSYILFGVTLMSPAGLVGALCHMVCHAFMKICSFFCAGSVIYKTEKNYVHELDGLGWKMPKVFAAFTISGLALMGVPGLCGFISKWNLVQAAVESGSKLAYAGVGCLLVSALLTAVYMLSISVRAFLPAKQIAPVEKTEKKDPNWMMILPLTVFVIVMVVLGVYSQPLVDLLTAVAAGTF